MMLRKAAWLATLSVLVSLALAACGGDGKKARQSCDTEADCGGGVCFDSECYTACASQDDCQAGEELCVKRKDQQGAETLVCVVATDYEGCQLQQDCDDLVARGCENKGCDTTTGLCFVRDKDDGVTCTTPDAHTGTCQAGVCTCTPDCVERECGADGCGGFCGTSSIGECPKANEECEEGQCVCKPDCTGRECGSDGCGGLCGTLDGDCPGMQDECVEGQCVCQPACDGKVCGANGCGGECGACSGEQEVCVQGACVCAPDCLQKECGDDGCGDFCGELEGGACPGVQDACVDGACVCQPSCVDVDGGAACGDDGCGGFCGDLEEGTCAGAQDACVDGLCVCQPACEGRDCGPDGCGGFCGELEGGLCAGPQDQCLAGVCTCVAACTGKECGADGCGGFCGALPAGACPGAQDACLEGQCLCQPDCDGKVCGADGCGGECGVCTGCNKCDAGACVADPCCLVPATGCCDGEVLRICVKTAEGKKVQQQDCACDNDAGIPCGVGPFCGWNPFAQVYACGTNGGTEPNGALAKDCPACIPACDGRECGGDGCGGDGTCGTCEPWDTCDGGTCTNFCEQSCEGRECGPDACGGSCGACADGLACTDGGDCVTVCAPQCAGRQCGPDGCGGLCGACEEGLFCNNGECSTTCVAQACGQRECGDDGCGGACGPHAEGVCPDGLLCTIDGKCGNWCTTCTYDPSCSALGFESGDFFGWALEGQARVVEGLGEALPYEGLYAASLATGGVPSASASASFDLCLPTDVNLIELEWRLFSEEFDEHCELGDQDRVRVLVEGLSDGRQVAVLDATIRDLCAPEACPDCGSQHVGLEPAGVAFDQGDVWRTPWSHLSQALRTLVKTNEGRVRLHLLADDAGDGAFDTRLLVDDVRFIACDPQCTGRECGPDACGGFCGDEETGRCPTEGDVCTTTGACCEPVCFPGQQCGSDGCEGSCGECAANEACELGFCVCVPDCAGKACGPDGCGGVCGDNDGACVTDGDVCRENGTCCTPACEGLECGDNGCGGDCWFTGHPDSLFCGVDTEAVCLAGTCCVPDCSDKQCGADGCGGECGPCQGAQDACVDFQCVCQPACDGFACGDDGCGSTCGQCEGPQDACVDHQCVCQPACLDVQCGPDGCGDDCWWLLNPGSVDFCGGEDNRVCVEGTCCVPECTGKVCGADNCGGSCGTCEAGFACNGAQCIEGAVFCADDDLCSDDAWSDAEQVCVHPPHDCDDDDPATVDACNPATGACEYTPCQPVCDDAWECGDDGCGGQCGVCEGDGVCLPETRTCCFASFSGTCGDDGCGRSLGTCAEGSFCVEVDEFVQDCVPCDDSDLCTTDWVDAEAVCHHDATVCDDDNAATLDACEPSTGACVFTPCDPTCDPLWQCGPNACGTSCGACEGVQDQCVDHACICQPACGGKQCGPDGCGGECGQCELPNVCDTGLGVCVPGT